MKLVSVVVIDPPSELPVTVAEFVDHARLNALTVDRQPELIERELAAATAKGESYCRRSFMPQTIAALFNWDNLQPEENAKLIVLPRGAVIEILSVAADGSTVAADSGYRFDPLWGIVTLAAPANVASVMFKSGYPDAAAVPQGIKEGILEYAALLYDDRQGNRTAKYEVSSGQAIPAGIKANWRPYQIEVSG